MMDLMTFVVLLLGFGSTSLGILAERTRPKRDDIMLDGGECVYPMSPTFPLALVAAAMLLLAISLATRGCACCCRRRDGVSNTSFGFGILFAVLSWLLALNTVFMFLVAAALNLPGRRAKSQECYAVVQAGNLFTQDAYNGMFATVFGVASNKMLWRNIDVTSLPDQT